MPYKAFRASMQRTSYPLRFKETYFLYISGAVATINSANFPLSRTMTMSFLSSILVVTKALGMSMIATLRPSFASIVELSRTDSYAAVGEVASVLSMCPLCLLPPVTILPLMYCSRFCFRNRWDSSTLSYSVFDKVFELMGRKVSRIWSCDNSLETTCLPLFPHIFDPAFMDNWVIV